MTNYTFDYTTQSRLIEVKIVGAGWVLGCLVVNYRTQVKN